jgi:hypothetical protein
MLRATGAAAGVSNSTHDTALWVPFATSATRTADQLVMLSRSAVVNASSRVA